MNELISELNDYEWEDLSESVKEASKKVLLDTLAAILLGMQESENQRLVSRLTEEKGPYYVLGTDRYTHLSHAAFLMGTASVSMELDEGNQWSKGHPAAHVIPVMLTQIQRKQGYSGQAFLLDLVKSYELTSILGRSTQLSASAHAHGTWGVAGSAATLFFMEGVEEAAFIKGLDIAISFAMPTQWQTVREGALIRNVYLGQSIQNSFKSYDLLKSAIYAPKNNLAYVLGEVIGEGFELSNDHIQRQFDIKENYFKTHAFCRYVHAPIDAFKELVSQHHLTDEEIEEVKVITYQRASSLNNKAYHNALSAKFSIPFALASYLHLRRSDFTIFEEKYLQNPEIKALAQRVNVYHSEELDVNYPTVMPVVVKVLTRDGKCYEAALEMANGGPDDQLDFDRLAYKFIQMTKGIYSSKKQNELINYIRHFDEKEDVTELIDLLKN